MLVVTPRRHSFRVRAEPRAPHRKTTAAHVRTVPVPPVPSTDPEAGAGATEESDTPTGAIGIPDPTYLTPRSRRVEHAFGVLLTVAYDGRRFSGWARQTNARSVAGELEGAIAAVDPKASQTRGLSRTDAGVHAREQL